MKTKNIGLTIALAILSACATQGTQLRDTKDRTAEAQQADSAACMNVAENPEITSVKKQATYVWCMKGKGYVHEYAN